MCMYACAYVCVYVHIYVCMCVCTVCMHVCVCVCMCMCVCVCCICICVCTCVYTCTLAYVCVCVCIMLPHVWLTHLVVNVISCRDHVTILNVSTLDVAWRLTLSPTPSALANCTSNPTAYEVVRDGTNNR